MSDEIKSRLDSWNACCQSLWKFYLSLSYLKIRKTKTFNTVRSRVALYGLGTCPSLKEKNTVWAV